MAILSRSLTWRDSKTSRVDEETDWLPPPAKSILPTLAGTFGGATAPLSNFTSAAAKDTTECLATSCGTAVDVDAVMDVEEVGTSVEGADVVGIAIALEGTDDVLARWGGFERTRLLFVLALLVRATCFTTGPPDRERYKKIKEGGTQTTKLRDTRQKALK